MHTLLILTGGLLIILLLGVLIGTYIRARNPTDRDHDGGEGE